MKYRSMLFALAGAALAFAAFALVETTSDRAIDPRLEGVRSTGSPKAHAESKAARAEYFHKMLRDPKTDAIPKDARRADLAFYDELTRTNALAKPALDYNWAEVGPNDVGGRTRGLDVDVRNANVVIAAGVSGGIWKSTDKGSTWSMKTGTDQIPSVTYIAQDKRSGHEDTWYAVGGEYWGNSARSSSAYYYGAGLYKSTDNGESWTIVPGTEAGDQFSWDTKFDYVSRIVVSPTTGSLFMASHAFGGFQIHRRRLLVGPRLGRSKRTSLRRRGGQFRRRPPRGGLRPVQRIHARVHARYLSLDRRRRQLELPRHYGLPEPRTDLAQRDRLRPLESRHRLHLCLHGYEFRRQGTS